MRVPFALILVACLGASGFAAAGTARLRVNSPDADEGAGPGTTPLDFVITRSGDTASTVTLRYRTDDGTAFAPEDYAAIPESSVTFGSGQTSKTITVDIGGDSQSEADESLFLRLTGFSSVAGAPAYAASTFAGGSASGVVATDIDGDGRADLAVAGGSRVSLYLDGAAAGSFAAGNDDASAVAAADFNGDGLADLAVAHAAGEEISVFFNTTVAGATTASYADAGTFVAGSGARALAAADINGDGLADLAVTHDGSDSVSLFFNTTAAGAVTATYSDAGAFVAGTGAGALAAADLDGDHRADLAVTSPASDRVALFLNTTAPGASAASYADGGTVDLDGSGGAIAALDADGDGLADLAVAHATDDRIGVFLNRTTPGDATATFDGAGSFDPGDVARSITSADFNQDTLPDLAATDGAGVSMLLNRAAVFDDSEGTGTIRNDDATPPNPFSFVDQADVERNEPVTSAAVKVTGISGDVPVSVESGKYSIGCTGTFTSGSDTLRNGQTVCVRHTSSTAFNAATDTTLTVGGIQDTFTSVTLGRDTKPEPFTFTDVRKALLNSPQVSNAVTIRGINDPAPVSVTGGEYSIGCTASFTAEPGAISRDQTVCVRHTSAAVAGHVTDTKLTVGGVSDTFSSVTPTPDPDAYDAGAPSLADLLAGLLALALARRSRDSR